MSPAGRVWEELQQMQRMQEDEPRPWDGGTVHSSRRQSEHSRRLSARACGNLFVFLAFLFQRSAIPGRLQSSTCSCSSAAPLQQEGTCGRLSGLNVVIN